MRALGRLAGHDPGISTEEVEAILQGGAGERWKVVAVFAEPLEALLEAARAIGMTRRALFESYRAARARHGASNPDVEAGDD